MRAKLAILPLLILLTACASLGLAPAQSVSQRLAYAYGQNAGVRQAAATAVSVGTLTSAEGKAVLGLTDESRKLLDTAQLAVNAGDLSTAEARLQLAISVLEQVQARLNAQVRP